MHSKTSRLNNNLIVRTWVCNIEEVRGMPKRKSQGRKQAQVERHAKATARRERKAGLYCKPGDADFKNLSEQLRVQGLALKDVLGDGYVF